MYLTRRASAFRPICRLAQPIRRSYSAPRQQLENTPAEPEAFRRLAPWASSNLSSDSLISVIIRDHEEKPYQVQHALLNQISDLQNAPIGILDRSVPTLDLTPFETSAGLVFVYWLFNRRLPKLEKDPSVQQPIPTGKEKHPISPKEKQALFKHHRYIRSLFALGLIDAWRLGYALRSPRFQNDILLESASLLHLESEAASRSPDPHTSNAISWARRAFDATADLRNGREMREFAVDVAAKRVYDVGMNGWTLSLGERMELSGCAEFGAEVFGSLGGQIGTKGVGVRDFARVYLVDEGGEK